MGQGAGVWRKAELKSFKVLRLFLWNCSDDDGGGDNDVKNVNFSVIIAAAATATTCLNHFFPDITRDWSVPLVLGEYPTILWVCKRDGGKGLGEHSSTGQGR